MNCWNLKLKKCSLIFQNFCIYSCIYLSIVGPDSKATVVILVVIFVFLILWIPYLITRSLMAFNDLEIPPIINTSAVWILHISTVVNVVIYSLRRSDYRQAFKNVIRCTSMSLSRDLELSVTNRTGNPTVNLRRISTLTQTLNWKSHCPP